MTAKEAVIPNFPTMARPVRTLEWSVNSREIHFRVSWFKHKIRMVHIHEHKRSVIPAGMASMSRQASPPAARNPLRESRRLKGRTRRTRERAGISTKPNTNCVKYRFVPSLDTPSESP